MPPLVALILFIVLVIALLRIEYRRNPEASAALWVPIIWLLLCGSKPLGRWFQASESWVAGSEEEGSLIDRWALIVIILFAAFIVNKRKMLWSVIIKENAFLVVLFGVPGIECSMVGLRICVLQKVV